ncbi:hypothetical protein AKJ16_DCAP05862 [Drosera capensis]
MSPSTESGLPFSWKLNAFTANGDAARRTTSSLPHRRITPPETVNLISLGCFSRDLCRINADLERNSKFDSLLRWIDLVETNRTATWLRFMIHPAVEQYREAMHCHKIKQYSERQVTKLALLWMH